MKPSAEISTRLEARYAQLQLAVDQGETIDTGLWAYLLDSEQQLIQLMQGDPPPPTAPGSLEFSWALYFLNNDVPDWVTSLLRLLDMPQTRITSKDWSDWSAIWMGEGRLAGDGSLVSTALYGVVDPGWSLAFFDYVLLQLKKWPPYPPYPFGSNPRTLTVDGLSSLGIALFGDWGTGSYQDGNLPSSPSAMISRQIVAQYPDISIHLGDVYYAGDAAEEQDNLLGCWPKAPLGNFTLNSNHEMYDGGNGYFGTTLASAPFNTQQNGTSYFQIEFGNWIILGLDTAYYDTSFFFSDGAITDPNQIHMLGQAAGSGKKIMLLTHHNPIDITGSYIVNNTQSSLWQQVKDAMGGRTPDYWYWGHQHNGVVYTQGGITGNTLCRCLGGSGIPIGNASWLENNPNVVSYTNQPLADPTPQQALRVMNAFAILQFTEDEVTEKWFYQDGTPVAL